jgi:beta-1,4-mannosyl-glycoprotein beta-1,4-N-acetylglucosaminyltransferase
MIKKTFLLHVILGVFLTAAIANSKVYDCFMFFNEIELLKMRLEELDPVVDYFVLVESIETQRGDGKPLYFNDNRQHFEKYLNKIIHVIVDERHPEMDLWGRENFQRNCIARGLQYCNSSDLVIVSDLDEIPRPGLIQELVKTVPERNERLLEKGKDKKFKKHNKNKNSPSKAEKMFYLNGARAFEMSIYFFQLNRQTHNGESWGGGTWVGTVVTTYGMIKKFGVQHFRDYRWKFPKISNGGWHFTWMGGKDKIRKKIGSIVEGHPYGESIPDEELDRWINHHPVVPIDESFPGYVQRNFDYLKSLGFVAAD